MDFLSLTISAAKVLFQYGKAVIDAPKELKILLADMESALPVLEQLQVVLERDGSSTQLQHNLNKNFAKNGILDILYRDLKKAADKVELPPSGGKRIWKMAAWPIRKKQTYEIIASLERGKGTLILELQSLEM